ncbi:protein CyaY [mine drainage metagenome]|uniref:Protein CyaY n=1 Tax=mine drainage metagenome TaxID=410659 RepID=A0A1J5REK0_9ZZZZ
MNDLPQSDYLRLAEATLRSVEAAADAADLDSKREGGVLTLELDNGEKIIANLQPPLQELWLASKSGAYHFRYAGGAWLDTRGSRSFQALLRQALAELGGPTLQLD